MPIPTGLSDSDFVAWFDSRDLGSVSPVGVIPDVSGHGRNSVAVSSDRRATYVADRDGFPALKVGPSCFKALWGMTVPQPYTIFNVVEFDVLPSKFSWGVASGWNTANKHLTAAQRQNGQSDWVIENAGVGNHGYGGNPQAGVRYVLRLDIGKVDRLRVNGQSVIEGDHGSASSIGVTMFSRETNQRHMAGWWFVTGVTASPMLGDQVEAELLSTFVG